MLDIQLDDAAVLRALDLLQTDLTDWGPELQKSAEVVAARFDRNFLDSRALFAALSPATIKTYEAKQEKSGKPLVDPFAPLRGFADSLRIPATATKMGVNGSAFHIDRSSVTIGIDPDKVIYARRALLGYPGKTPERDALFIDDTEMNAINEIGQRGLEKRLQRSGGAG